MTVPDGFFVGRCVSPVVYGVAWIVDGYGQIFLTGVEARANLARYREKRRGDVFEVFSAMQVGGK